MFAEMRTGSNFLEANLNAVPGLSCHGEVFNPHFIGTKDQTELFDVSLAEREQNPLRLLRRMKDRSPGLAGFRYFHDHDPRIFDAVMDDPGCAKIILTRNPAESYVSWKIALATGQWKLTGPRAAKSTQVRFEPAEFEAHLDRIQRFQLRLLHRLQTSGQTAFYLDYEDIRDLGVLNGLAAWLGVAGRLTELDGGLKKQNPEDLSERVTNFDEMAASLARLDRFNLARTPNFEPRRSPAIPGFIAARDVPLLFMPVPGGPTEALSDWLGQFGGLEQGFTQKTLRDWKRAHPGHRSFTVLRHPLRRAHDAFAALIASAPPRDLREVFSTDYGLDLPAAGRLTYPTVSAHRTGFLAFLRLVRKVLGGQSALRVEPAWATQTAVLQGFAQFQPPDVILREARLPQGLAWLCDELQVLAPGLPAMGAPPAAILADERVREACRQTYARDYVGFGFPEDPG